MPSGSCIPVSAPGWGYSMGEVEDENDEAQAVAQIEAGDSAPDYGAEIVALRAELTTLIDALRAEMETLEAKMAAVLEFHHGILRTYFGSHFR